MPDSSDIVDLFKQPPNPHVAIYPIKVESTGWNRELIFDDELGSGFDAWKFGERIDGEPDIGPNAK